MINGHRIWIKMFAINNGINIWMPSVFKSIRAQLKHSFVRWTEIKPSGCSPFIDFWWPLAFAQLPIFSAIRKTPPKMGNASIFSSTLAAGNVADIFLVLLPAQQMNAYNFRFDLWPLTPLWATFSRTHGKHPTANLRFSMASDAAPSVLSLRMLNAGHPFVEILGSSFWEGGLYYIRRS